jgi:hypothetical protein
METLEAQSIYFFKRTGGSTDPFVNMSETLTVNNGRAVLTEIPDDFNKVRVSSDNISEVFIETKGLVDIGNYYNVDYNLGVVNFGSVMEGRKLKFDYIGTGIVYYPASRVYTLTDNGIPTESLQDVVDSSKAQISEHDSTMTNLENLATQKISETETARQNAITATNNANTAESSRATAESNRVSSENTRNSAETSRINAESSRATAESTRVTNESARVTAETNRSSAETGRVNTESARVTAESSRVSAESTRATNETTRQSQESTRLSQEAVRQAQETARETNTSNAITNINNLNTQLTNNTLVTYKGSVANTTALNAVATKATGDTYVQADTKAIYRWSGSAWVIIGYSATGGIVVSSTSPSDTSMIFIDLNE